MTDNVKIAIIVAIGPTLTGLVSAFVSYRNTKKLDVVHTMVNSGATEQLRVGMISAKALLAATPNSVENLQLAKIAEDKYNQAIKNSKLTA